MRKWQRAASCTARPCRQPMRRIVGCPRCTVRRIDAFERRYRPPHLLRDEPKNFGHALDAFAARQAGHHAVSVFNWLRRERVISPRTSSSSGRSRSLAVFAALRVRNQCKAVTETPSPPDPACSCSCQPTLNNDRRRDAAGRWMPPHVRAAGRTA